MGNSDSLHTFDQGRIKLFLDGPYFTNMKKEFGVYEIIGQVGLALMQNFPGTELVLKVVGKETVSWKEEVCKFKFMNSI